MSCDPVLLILARAAGTWVSGEEIASTLGMSRAAVWKRVQTLRSRGYEVEATSGRGYRLLEKPDLLNADEILASLRTEVIGRRIHLVTAVSSTNTLAREMAQGSPDGTVVVSETQTDGRGRLSRQWVSPPGGIYMSLILKPDIPLAASSRINMAVAVAICRALKSYVPAATIKWPNDILIDGRKVCGILTEVSAQMDRLEWAVAGVGINVNNQPPMLREWNATSLSMEAGRMLDRNEVLFRLLHEIDIEYRMTLQDPAKVYGEWCRLSATVGRSVQVLTGAREFYGIASSLDHDGSLLLDTADGPVRVLAGDCIHLRAPKSHHEL